MPQKDTLIKMECTGEKKDGTKCKQVNYYSRKNKKKIKVRLEKKKYCKYCKKHTLHKETK